MGYRFGSKISIIDGMLKQIQSFSIGLACGAAVAVPLVLLLTPASGDDLRQQIQQSYQNLLTESAMAAEARRAELRQELAGKIAARAATKDDDSNKDPVGEA